MQNGSGAAAHGETVVAGRLRKALGGALEQVLGKRCRDTHVESVPRGGSRDVFRFEGR